MAITYTWKITGMKKAPNLNGLSDVITNINFLYKGVDSEKDSDGNNYEAYFNGACPIAAPDKDSFTDLNNVTEADVIEWAKANHPVEQMNIDILNKLNSQKTPKNVNVDAMPWA